MKKKTTFRAMLIVSAFALLTLPSMMTASAGTKSTGTTPNNCLAEFYDCSVTGDPSCIDAYNACMDAQ